jgi:TonB family protein
MKNLLAIFILNMLSISGFAQSDNNQSGDLSNANSEEIVPEDVFLITTTKPVYPGGRQAMIEFISNNLRYPKSAAENKVEGKVTLKFIIDSHGKICCIDIIGEPIGYGLEEEAIRIVKSMPLWYPAYMDDKQVAVYYRLPIIFKYFEEEQE